MFEQNYSSSPKQSHVWSEPHTPQTLQHSQTLQLILLPPFYQIIVSNTPSRFSAQNRVLFSQRILDRLLVGQYFQMSYLFPPGNLEVRAQEQTPDVFDNTRSVNPSRWENTMRTRYSNLLFFRWFKAIAPLVVAIAASVHTVESMWLTLVPCREP